ncbi:unnamed protein product [Closterium sp. NIES-53]
MGNLVYKDWKAENEAKIGMRFGEVKSSGLEHLELPLELSSGSTTTRQSFIVNGGEEAKDAEGEEEEVQQVSEHAPTLPSRTTSAPRIRVTPQQRHESIHVPAAEEEGRGKRKIQAPNRLTYDAPGKLAKSALAGAALMVGDDEESDYDECVFAFFSPVEMRGVPATLKKAVESSDAEEWKKEMESELKRIEENGTWELVELPEGHKAITSKWLFKIKSDADGKIERYKSRLVARRYRQKEKVDYKELFAPVVNPTTLRTLLAGATIKGWVVKQMDVTTAFLNGILEEEIFMAQPEGFDDGSGRVWNLKKALYGLNQAPRQWYLKLREVLEEIGFTPSSADHSLFMLGEGEQRSFMVVYVEDILIFSPSSDLAKEVMLKIQDKFKCKALGDVSFYLGLHIERYVEKLCMRVHQRKYLEALAANFGQSEGHVATPFPSGFKCVKGPEEESVGEEERRCFHSLVGSLMYAVVNTRPDVAFATGQLARVVQCFNEEQIAAGMRVAMYLGKHRPKKPVKFLGPTDSFARSCLKRPCAVRPCSHSVALPCSYSHCPPPPPPPRTLRPAAARASRSAAPPLTPCCSLHVTPFCPARRALLQPARPALLQPARRALLPCASRPAAASASRPTAASASRSAAPRVTPCCSQRAAPYCSQRVMLCCPTRRALLPCTARALLPCPPRALSCSPWRALPGRAVTPSPSCPAQPEPPRPTLITSPTEPPAATTAAAAACATDAAGGGAAGARRATRSAGGAAGAGGAGPTADRHCLSWPLSRLLQRLGMDSGGHCLSRMTPPLSSFASGFFSEPVQVVEALAAALGASESTVALGASESAAALGSRASPATGPSSAEALHTFTLDSGASRCFFRDYTTLTPLAAPVPVSLADPTGGPVVAQASSVLPVSSSPLRGQRVAICTCSRTGHHLATFPRWPGSSLYTLTTASAQVAEAGQVAASSQVSAFGQLAASCSCRVLSHQTLLWHHHLGHPSLPRLRGMHSHLLVSGLPRSLPSLLRSPAPLCLPCVEGRQCAAPHSSEFPPTTAPLQTLHMDVWGPAPIGGMDQERYFLLAADDYTRYTTVFPLRRKVDVSGVLIPLICASRRQRRERFSQDFPALRLHSDRGGEFSSDLLAEFC